MRYSVLGFNQEAVMQTDLDLTDLMLLQYIMQANGNPEMKHIVKDDIAYVWLSHNKIHKDLPILRITEGTLKNRLLALKKKNLIMSETVKLNTGSMTYYSVTTVCTSLINDVPRHSKMTSDNIQEDITNTDNTIVLSQPKTVEEQFFIQETVKEKPKKKNLFDKCIDAINEFTDDEEVRDKLVDFLKIRLERRDTPLGIQSFKGILKKLRTLTESKQECLQIIQQSIDRSYLSFFPLMQRTYTKKTGKDIETTSFSGELQVVSNEDKDKIRRLVESGELEEY